MAIDVRVVCWPPIGDSTERQLNDLTQTPPIGYRKAKCGPCVLATSCYPPSLDWQSLAMTKDGFSLLAVCFALFCHFLFPNLTIARP